MDLTKVKTIKELLNKYHLAPNKLLGQHFLLSKRVINKIINAAELKSSDTILEIGPGLGTLTLELARYAKKIIAVEIDQAMINILSNNIKKENLHSIKIVNSDILKITSYQLPVTNYSLVANLPYQITSPVLWRFLHEEKHKPIVMVLMIQKEVAGRIVEKPGHMSLLSVLVQYYAEPKIICNIKKGLFFPQPQVDSTVIKLIIKNQVLKISNEPKFFKLVKAGFIHKRKKIVNGIPSVLKLSKNKVLNTLKELNLSENIRAQELTIADWINIYKMVYNTDN